MNEALEQNSSDQLIRVTGMYKDWFLDYASYVILERAVPAIEDGFKPVQRRILHSMKDLDDGRYNKVANIVGHTMQYHPHGDASIADAILELFKKREYIDIFNKKALYIFIREQIDVKTPKITKIANVLYAIFKEKYMFYLEHNRFPYK